MQCITNIDQNRRDFIKNNAPNENTDHQLHLVNDPNVKLIVYSENEVIVQAALIRIIGATRSVEEIWKIVRKDTDEEKALDLYHCLRHDYGRKW